MAAKSHDDDDDRNRVPLREYLDALEHARERAQDQAAVEREKSASILRTPVDTTDVPLREYFEVQRSGDQRALDMAAAERASAAEVLRDEQRRALTVAQEEREKAAQRCRRVRTGRLPITSRGCRRR